MRSALEWDEWEEQGAWIRTPNMAGRFNIVPCDAPGDFIAPSDVIVRAPQDVRLPGPPDAVRLPGPPDAVRLPGPPDAVILPAPPEVKYPPDPAASQAPPPPLLPPPPPPQAPFERTLHFELVETTSLFHRKWDSLQNVDLGAPADVMHVHELQQIENRGRLLRLFRAKFGVSYLSYRETAAARKWVDERCPGAVGPVDRWRQTVPTEASKGRVQDFIASWLARREEHHRTRAPLPAGATPDEAWRWRREDEAEYGRFLAGGRKWPAPPAEGLADRFAELAPAEEEAEAWEYAAGQVAVPEKPVPQLDAPEELARRSGLNNAARGELLAEAEQLAGKLAEKQRRLAADKRTLNTDERRFDPRFENWLVGPHSGVPAEDFARLRLSLNNYLEFIGVGVLSPQTVAFGVERFCSAFADCKYRAVDPGPLEDDPRRRGRYRVAEADLFAARQAEVAPLVRAAGLVFVPLLVPAGRGALLVWSPRSGFHLLGRWAAATAQAFIADAWAPAFGEEHTELTAHAILDDELAGKPDKAYRVLMCLRAAVEVVRVAEVLPGDGVSELYQECDRMPDAIPSTLPACQGLQAAEADVVNSALPYLAFLAERHFDATFKRLLQTWLSFELVAGVDREYSNAGPRDYARELEEYKATRAEKLGAAAALPQHLHLADLAGRWLDALPPSDPRRAQCELACGWHTARAEALHRRR